ncbi:hypothetical protein NL676_013470 [Syzygium grande]|nr:hypothetical protein NL676_013470 [Syzygium grande]
MHDLSLLPMVKLDAMLSSTSSGGVVSSELEATAPPCPSGPVGGAGSNGHGGGFSDREDKKILERGN